jgi:hypothetical protein
MKYVLAALYTRRHDSNKSKVRRRWTQLYKLRSEYRNIKSIMPEVMVLRHTAYMAEMRTYTFDWERRN